MKKTLAIVLAIVMALGCFGLTAFAAENETNITAEITAADFGYTMVIPTTTTLTEANHENVLLGTDGKVSIKDIKHPTDKVNVSYTVDLTNGNLTDGTNTINATYKYKQGDAEFAAIDGTTKVTVYANATVNDSFVNVTANKDQWDAAPEGTYNASVTFNFEAEEAEAPAAVTAADALTTDARYNLKFNFNGTMLYSITCKKTEAGFEVMEILENGTDALNKHGTSTSEVAGTKIIFKLGIHLQFTLDTSTSKYEFTGNLAANTVITGFSVKPAGATEFTEISLTKAE